MRHLKNTERSNATVAEYNMREDGNDVRDVQDLFNFMDCDVRAIQAVRIGHHDKSSSRKVHLLKELQSIFEKNNLLQASKFLRDHSSIAKISIKRWLQLMNLKEFKVIQKQCCGLLMMVCRLANT